MDYRKILIAGAIAAAVVPSPATAATEQTTGEALILLPLELTKIDDLDFGSVIPSGVSGTVTINAGTGARSFTGGATGVPSATGQRAYFGGAGTPGQQVFVGITPPTQLNHTSTSATIPVLALTLDGAPMRVIDPITRTFFIGVGGVLQINPNQAEGLYEATFDVTAIYL